MVEYGGMKANMGPFAPVSLKGKANINGVPTFIKSWPLTQGGICGEQEGIPYGRLVSIVPSDNRRAFRLGVPAGGIATGICALEPTKMRVDPGMNDRYFYGEAMDVFRMGLIDILNYDLTQSAPMLGSTVWGNTTTGEIAFNDGTDITSDGYVKLNAFVYESLDPNGAKVFFNAPTVDSLTRETTTKAATPTITPAAGAVAAGTEITMATDTPGAAILYTVDGTQPTWQSTRYEGPVVLSATCTFKAIAVCDGYDPSATATSAYTLA